VEGHSSRLEPAEDRISELEDKIETNEKSEKILARQLKSCEKNIQELSNSIKRPNLRIMGIEEEEEFQAKGIHNIFNKITEHFQNLEKVLSIQVQETSRTPSRLNQNRTSDGILSLKQQAQRAKKEY
jgi:chromosome segregation ATPase